MKEILKGRRPLMVALTIIGLLSSFNSLGQGGNLISNPSFEDSLGNPSLNGWYQYGAFDTTFFNSSTDVPTGGGVWSVRLATSFPHSHHLAWYVTGIQGTNIFELSVWAKKTVPFYIQFPPVIIAMGIIDSTYYNNLSLYGNNASIEGIIYDSIPFSWDSIILIDTLTTQFTDTIAVILMGGTTINGPNDYAYYDLAELKMNDSTMVLLTSTSEISCYSYCDGNATAYVGGIPPFTYQWNDPSNQTTQTATGLCAGTYTVIAIDSIGQLDSAKVNIVEPLALTINLSSSICDGDSIFLGGEYQKIAGIYYDSLISVNGCDSIIEATLTVNPAYSYGDSAVDICNGDSALIYGAFRTIAGTYFDSLITVNGCDSVYSTVFTISPNYNTSATAVDICNGDSVMIFGISRTIAGTYYDSLTAINGCDSIITTTLFVNPTYNISAGDINICSGDSVQISGDYRKTDGTYYDSLISVNGCDSITITTLIVDQTYDVNTPDETVCTGDSIVIFGGYRKTAGVYYDSSATVSGCDSITTTTLIVNPLPLVNFSGLDSIYCSMDAAVALTGVPDSGTFSGMGVANNYFYPTTGVNTYVITYSYTDSLGCSGSYSQSVIVEFCVGIDDNIYSDLIKVHPNPTTGKITLTNLPQNSQVNISVFNIYGQKVATLVNNCSHPSTQATATFDARNLSSGIYYCTIRSGNKVVETFKMIKVDGNKESH